MKNSEILLKECTNEESSILTNLGFYWEQDTWCEPSWFCDNDRKYSYIGKHGYMIITKELKTNTFKLYTNYGYDSDLGKEHESWEEFGSIELLAEYFN